MIATVQIQALVKLIDDPDDQVYAHVKEEIKKCGAEVIPFLEHSWNTIIMG